MVGHCRSCRYPKPQTADEHCTRFSLDQISEVPEAESSRPTAVQNGPETRTSSWLLSTCPNSIHYMQSFVRDSNSKWWLVREKCNICVDFKKKKLVWHLPHHFVKFPCKFSVYLQHFSYKKQWNFIKNSISLMEYPGQMIWKKEAKCTDQLFGNCIEEGKK